MNHKTKSRGESLTETVIALSILSIGITMSSLVISNALRNITVSKDRVIAVSIAREGLEAMRNIRDTNWLKFSNDQRSCWNHFPGETVATDLCDGSTPIEPNENGYIIYKNNEFRWKLDEATQGVEDASLLYEVDIDNNVDTNGDGDVLNDPDIYNHILTTNDDALNYGSSPTPFKRVITIEYLENDPDPTSAPSNTTPPNDTINTAAEWGDLADQNAVNRILVTSTVTWEETNQRGTVVHNTDLKTILTDYLGRDNLDS